MTTQERLNLIKQVGEEIISEEELKKLLESGEQLIAYDGFEPSGQMHIAQGLLRTININKMVKAGIKFKMLVADWHAWANNKMGGDLGKIQTIGKYFIETWKACGMDLNNVEFVWASHVVRDDKYWKLVLQIARTNTLRRFVRTAEIMGREESMNLTAAQIIYPCMQAADIFTLGAKITELGMDQRKVNMLAREVGPILGFWKPIVVSHHMLMGLQQNKMEEDGKSKIEKTIEMKMSKSKPDSAIFMTDSEEDIKRKINKAYCPEGETVDNPVLEYYKYIIFESLDRLRMEQVIIDRSEKFGGPIILNSYENLEKMFSGKQIHPQDLKLTLANLLNKLVEPVRKHFEQDLLARPLLEKVKSYQVTR